MDAWILNWISCVMELSRLLGLKFVRDGEGYRSVGGRTIVGEFIVRIGLFHNQGDYTIRDVEIARLVRLVKDLQTIEHHDPSLLGYFRKKLRDTSQDLGTYIGARTEINIAASLITKGVEFVKTESPDFRIRQHGVCIECTNANRSAKGSAGLLGKIRTAIVQKSRKPYCNTSTALAMDITNIAATNDSEEDKLLSRKNALGIAVGQILRDEQSKYGSVLLFSYFMNTEAVYYSGYWRVDSEDISESLALFLDRYYPMGDLKTGPGWTPKAG